MNLRQMALFAGLLAGQFALAAAAADPAPAAPAAARAADAPALGHGSRPAGIAWFDGGVADAFAAAQDAHKPVFLYWGAVWCPPCQELKATVFRRQDFLDRLTLFVPVYLDGDSAGAQSWGERFHISGYPTVLVLRSDQAELERVSGGMDLARYAEVLDLALAEVRPAKDLLASLGKGGGTLSATDCRQLAYNDWRSDEAWYLDPETLGPTAEALDRAARRCPLLLRLERTRLQMTAANAAVRAQGKMIESGKPASARTKALLQRVPAILADRPLALAAGDTMQFLPAEFFTALVQMDPGGRSRLQTRYFALMDALSTDPRYSAADHLYSQYSKLVAAKALDPAGKIPEALARSVTHQIDESLAREHDPYARASLVNAALNVLDLLGDEERARSILEGEIRTAAYPYYYMSDLAELEEQRGHREAAVDWLARSYATAQGPATRFQWGVGYVRGLVRMQPQDETAIRDAAIAVLSDLDAAGDLHGRTRRSLKKLEASLRDWNRDAAHAAAIDVVRERMHSICGKFPADDSARPACEEFLAPS